MSHEASSRFVDLGSVANITGQFSEGEPDGSPTSPGLNLVYPVAPEKPDQEPES
jgi:hypothetical protein